METVRRSGNKSQKEEKLKSGCVNRDLDISFTGEAGAPNLVLAPSRSQDGDGLTSGLCLHAGSSPTMHCSRGHSGMAGSLP